MTANCIQCGSEYERPEKSTRSYCKKCGDIIKSTPRFNHIKSLKIKNCYDYPPTRKG